MGDAMSTDVKVSLVEYEARAQRGDFDGLNHRRVELIYGEIRDISPAGDPARCIDWIAWPLEPQAHPR